MVQPQVLFGDYRVSFVSLGNKKLNRVWMFLIWWDWIGCMGLLLPKDLPLNWNTNTDLRNYMYR